MGTGGHDETDTCCRLNYAFITGRNGLQVMSRYCRMITNLQDEQWTPRLSDVHRLQSTSDMLLALWNVWRRMVKYFDDPRWDAFRACSPDGGETFRYEPANVQEVMSALRAQMTACGGCLDKAFAQEQLRMFDRDERGLYEHLKGTARSNCTVIDLILKTHGRP